MDALETAIQALKNDPNATPEFRKQLDNWLQVVEDAIKKAGATPPAPVNPAPVAAPPVAAPPPSQPVQQTPDGKPFVPVVNLANNPASNNAPPPSAPPAQNVQPPASPGKPSVTSDGHGANTVDITNTTGKEQSYGLFLNGGSTTVPVYQIKLKPGETGTLKYENGQGGFIAQANSQGAYQWDASRLEFYAEPNGVNNTNVSYIPGRNASIQVSDGLGAVKGDTKSIANVSDPRKQVTYDAGGNPTITGYFDANVGDNPNLTPEQRQAKINNGQFMDDQLGTGGAYLRPHDDTKRGANPTNDGAVNPMTMAGTKSQHFTATFGDA